MSTPRTDAAKFKICCSADPYNEVVSEHVAAELETELQETNALVYEARALVKRLYDELATFDCDDSGQDLKAEVRAYLNL